MFKNIQITGLAYEVDDNTRKYVNKRIGSLFRYLPRRARASVSCEVRLSEVNHSHGNKYQAEVVLSVPNKVLTATDSTGNILAAIDIVEAKIRSQIQQYKEISINHIAKRGTISRFRRKLGLLTI